MKQILTLALLVIPVASLSAYPRVVGQFDRTLSVTGPVDLEAITTSGGIVVTGGTAGTVRVHAILEANNEWLPRGAEARIREIERNPPVEQNGNHLRIGYMSDSRLLEGISMRLEIEVPRATNLHAKANSGGVRASNIRGPVACQTHSGSVQIQDVEADVQASANSGGIHIARVNGSVTARTHSGGIEVESAGSSIDAEANSGGIRLSQVRPASIRAQTSSGGVTVHTAAGAGYDITADIGSGRITTPEMTVQSGFSRHHVEGKVRGGGPQVAVRASSGSVRIE